MGRVDEVYTAAMRDPEAFWAAAAAEIDWTRKWDRVLDDSDAPYHRWVAGRALHICYNAVDRPVEGGSGAQAAVIYASPVPVSGSSLPYRAPPDHTDRLAGTIDMTLAGYGKISTV